MTTGARRLPQWLLNAESKMSTVRRNCRICSTLARPTKNHAALAEINVDAETGVVSIDGQQRYQTIVGLEIHAQLDVTVKLFSNSSPPMGGNVAPNWRLALLDGAVPGSLPILSHAAVQTALRAATALQCQIMPTSRWERKHYFYADLPAGYQITQQRWPLARNGLLQVGDDGNNDAFVCRIDRIQLEQDTGKTIQSHEHSLIDLNRSGGALVEIVTAPDLRSAAAAKQWVSALRLLLRHVHVCDGQMQHGSLRVDVNVNLKHLHHDDAAPTTRTTPRSEVKNLNSLQHVHDAIVYESQRQARAVVEHASLVPDTRLWNVNGHCTELLRQKHQADDYRFLPDPDLPPLVLDKLRFDGFTWLEYCQQSVTELPQHAAQRLQSHGLSAYQAQVICADPPAIGIFDEALQTIMHDDNADVVAKARPKVNATATMIANLLINNLFGLVNDVQHITSKNVESTMAECPISGQQLAEVVVMIENGDITNNMAKQLLEALFDQQQHTNAPLSPRQVAHDLNLHIVSDERVLREWCAQVLHEHPAELVLYRRGGKYVPKITKLFMGKAMAKGGRTGAAHPERLGEVLTEMLQETTCDHLAK